MHKIILSFIFKEYQIDKNHQMMNMRSYDNSISCLASLVLYYFLLFKCHLVIMPCTIYFRMCYITSIHINFFALNCIKTVTENIFMDFILFESLDD